jgi:outer membrane protein assembly factor BamD (BamD/ComL family)
MKFVENRIESRTKFMKFLYSLGVVALAMYGPLCMADALRGGVLRPTTIYISPDASSARLADLERGREVVLLETSRDWAHVEANLTEERVVTGWVLDKDVVKASTPDGDKVLFGEAVDSEDQASQRHGRSGAAQDAMRLYLRTSEVFPNSPLAGEALYRAADIQWQIDKADVMSRSSAKEQEAYLREGMNEELMKKVIKKFSGSKWADLAAFHLIDNKLCGDWQGQSKCPAKESEMYENYAKDHPSSPALAEALYDAAWRWAALIELYKSEDQQKKSEASKAKAIAIAQKVVSQFPQSDWGARAERLLYMIEHEIPTYGNGAN